MVIRSGSFQKTSWQKRTKRVPLELAVSSIQAISGMTELDGGESMYDITEENIIKLRGLLDIPFLSFDGIEKYQTLAEKAAVIFCATIRGHKFGNGNKRTAVILLLLILYVNKKWISFSWSELYDLAMGIAKSVHIDFDMQVGEVAQELAKRIIRRP